MNTDLTILKKPGEKKKDDLQMWTSAQEQLLAEWSEKATCYRWLHSRSEKSYRTKNYSFTIPVIILSTLTGTANFAMDSFVPEEHKQIAMACVGGVNIFAGILSTLQNFLRYAELMESHRLCEVQWSKFGRNIAVELALDPKRRKPANDFLKVCRAEYDRLIEQSPPIDDHIIKQFKTNFKSVDIRKPDICNGLHKCKIFEKDEIEKKADIIKGVSEKLLNKSKAFKLPKNEPHKFKKEENIKELHSLMKIGKVSSFKKNDIKIKEKNENPLDVIHDILKKSPVDNKPDINDTKDDNKIDNTKDDDKIDDKIDDTKDDIEMGSISEEEKTDFLNEIK